MGDRRESIRPGGSFPLGRRRVGRIGYGAMGLERLAGDPAAGVRLVRDAVERGVDHIDTADFYGDGAANRMIRAAIGADDRVVVVSKGGALREPRGTLGLRAAQRPEELRAGVEDNLRALGRERIDVVNLRRLDVGPGLTAEGDQIVDLDDQLAVMIAMREEGLIGDIGLSGVDLEGLQRALAAGIVQVQNAHSFVDRRFEDLLELCRSEGIAWVPFFPLGSAFPGAARVDAQPEATAAAARLGATPAQTGLAWLLAHAPNILLIPGTTSAAHLAENLAAAEVALDAATLAELDGVWRRIAREKTAA